MHCRSSESVDGGAGERGQLSLVRKGRKPDRAAGTKPLVNSLSAALDNSFVLIE